MTGSGQTTFHNRVDSVGRLQQADQIFNAEHQTFVYQSSGLPSRLPFHASLRQLNRVEQIEQLVEVVDTARYDKRGRPLVVVLNGLVEDELLSFVQRLAEHSFESDMLLRCDYLGHFDWPQRSLHRTVMQLINAISQKRNEPVPERASAEAALAQLFADHDRSIAFAHVVEPETCRKELLRSWADFVAEKCVAPKSGLLICFLCIQRRSTRSDDGAWIIDELQELAEACGLYLVNGLDPIAPRDLDGWIAQYNFQPVLPDLAHIDPELTNRVFGGRERLSYREVISRVLELLAPLLKPSEPRWVAESR